MTDRPMLFSAPMIRALHREATEPGTGKTQTRRVIKPSGRCSLFDGSWTDSYVLDPGNASWRAKEARYAPGDRLWVKETWAKIHVPHAGSEWIIYKAEDNRTDYGGPWKSPLFLPRSASRLTLLVSEVRVERLQSISEEDAKAEGVYETEWYDAAEHKVAGGAPWTPERLAYADLWNHLNGKKPGLAWADNPWIVAVTFRPVLANIDKEERSND